MLAGDAEDGAEQVVEAGHAPPEGGVRGRVVLVGGAAWGREYAWSCGRSVSSPSLQETELGEKNLISCFSDYI